MLGCYMVRPALVPFSSVRLRTSLHLPQVCMHGVVCTGLPLRVAHCLLLCLVVGPPPLFSQKDGS